MCGRFTLATPKEDISALLPEVELDQYVYPRFNIAPTQTVAVLTEREPNKLVPLRWGLIPSWAKDTTTGYKMINTRAETIGEKPYFRNLMTGSRCIILADGFFEWKMTPNGKIPYYFRLKDESLFGFAGLWDRWRDSVGRETRSCTIITTTPNELVAEVHNRMPVMVDPANFRSFLLPADTNNPRYPFLSVQFPAIRMKCYPVGKLVNNVANDSADLLRPLLPSADLLLS